MKRSWTSSRSALLIPAWYDAARSVARAQRVGELLGLAPGRRRRRSPAAATRRSAPPAPAACARRPARRGSARPRTAGWAGRTRGSAPPGRAARAARRSRRAPAAPRSRSARAPAGARAPRSPRPAAGTRAGSRGPTRDTQCASSTTNSDTSATASSSSTDAFASCSGARNRNSSASSASSRQRLLALGARGSVEFSCAAPPGGDLAQRVDLVALERDQRRHDDGRAGRQQPGDLVDRRLARAGGHDDQHVAPVQRRLDRLPLPRPQRLEAERLARHPLDPPDSSARTPRVTAMDQPWSGRKLHFVGIGGAGMSGLATVAHALGADDHRLRPRRAGRAGRTRRPATSPRRPRGGERPGGRDGRLLHRDQARQPRAHDRRARAAPRRPARRDHPPQADDRRLRHPRQDDDVEHARARAARRRGRPELPGRRRGPQHRRQRRLGSGGVARGRGRRVRPLAAEAAPDDRGGHQRGARPPHDLRLAARRRRARSAPSSALARAGGGAARS